MISQMHCSAFFCFVSCTNSVFEAHAGTCRKGERAGASGGEEAVVVEAPSRHRCKGSDGRFDEGCQVDDYLRRCRCNSLRGRHHAHVVFVPPERLVRILGAACTVALDLLASGGVTRGGGHASDSRCTQAIHLCDIFFFGCAYSVFRPSSPIVESCFTHSCLRQESC